MLRSAQPSFHRILKWWWSVRSGAVQRRTCGTSVRIGRDSTLSLPIRAGLLRFKYIPSSPLPLGADRWDIDADALQSHDDGQRRRGLLDDFLLDFNPAQVDEFRSRQAQRFAVGPIGDPALLFRFFTSLFSFLELDHRDLALLLNDRLRRLLHDTLGRQNAADHHAIEPHWDVLLLNQLALDFSCDGILQLRPGGWIGRQLKQGILLHLLPHEGPERFFHIGLVPVESEAGDQLWQAALYHVGNREGVEGHPCVLGRDNVEMLGVLKGSNANVDDLRRGRQINSSGS